MNMQHEIYRKLQAFGLSADEAKVYTELLKTPATHLGLSQVTGVNRTKVYRIAQDLEHRGLIVRQRDDRGAFLVACDPGVLESSVILQEQKAMEQRGALQQILPVLQTLKQQGENLFTMRSYDGLDGLKQMCWHELKAKGDLLTLGSGTIEELIPNHYWAEKHRALSVDANYRVYEIINDTNSDTVTFTENQTYMEHFHFRILPAQILRMENQLVVYNNTVATYHWRQNQKCGVEIINESYANMIRQMFWHYWGLARDPGV